MKEPNRPHRSSPLGQWACDMMDWVRSAIVQNTPTVKATRTTAGTFLEAKGGAAGEGASLQFKGQWVDGDYAEGDIVICEIPTTEVDRPPQAGTFIAGEAVSTGDLHPGLDPQTAAATATVDAGAVDAIEVTNLGEGYNGTAPAVAISGGGGSGATAHANLDASGEYVTSITVDTGGSGYGSPPTVTIDPPTQLQKWEDFARGNWAKLTLRPDDGTRKRQKIVINSGRDSGEVPAILINKRVGSDGVGAIFIDIADIEAVGAAPEGGARIIKLREWEVCEDGEIKHILVLSGESY